MRLMQRQSDISFQTASHQLFPTSPTPRILSLVIHSPPKAAFPLPSRHKMFADFEGRRQMSFTGSSSNSRHFPRFTVCYAFIDAFEPPPHWPSGAVLSMPLKLSLINFEQPQDRTPCLSANSPAGRSSIAPYSTPNFSLFARHYSRWPI